MDVKYNAAAEIGLDRRLWRTMRSASNLKEKVAEVFELLRDPVYQYLGVLLANREEAEDLTQEVFLRLYHCLYKGQAVNNVRAWVFWVAHNLALNQRRNDSKSSQSIPGLGIGFVSSSSIRLQMPSKRYWNESAMKGFKQPWPACLPRKEDVLN